MRRGGHVEVKDDQLAGCALGRAGRSAPYQMLALQVVVCDGGRVQDVNEAFGLFFSTSRVIVVDGEVLRDDLLERELVQFGRDELWEESKAKALLRQAVARTLDVHVARELT